MSYNKEKYLANAKAIKEMLDTHVDFKLKMGSFLYNPKHGVLFKTPEELREFKHTCGTSYCLAGYQAYLANYPDEFINEDGDFCHTSFSKAISGAGHLAIAWNFIYDASWPNTRESAYKRVNYIIENNGEIPPEEDWEDFE